jgi:hypothetical protein
MQVQAALVIMSIMGCDDSGTQCVTLSQNESTWETLDQCDNASADALNNFPDANYPVVVALCQTETAQGTPEAVTPEQDADVAEATVPEPPVKEQKPKTLVELMSNLTDKAAPITESVKSVLIDKPVHVVKDSYSWVVKKLR